MMRELMKEDITGAFGVPFINETVRRMVNICTEKVSYVSNVYFKTKNVYK